MESELRNSVSSIGNYNSIPTSVTSATSVVTMVDGLSITKTADKQIWADSILTYTIVIDNQTEKTYESPTVTDILDNNLIEFVDDSVTIDDVKATSSEYLYNDSEHKLIVNLEDLDPSSTKVIKFQVSKK